VDSISLLKHGRRVAPRGRLWRSECPTQQIDFLRQDDHAIEIAGARDMDEQTGIKFDV
jgi:hypothetical protein